MKLTRFGITQRFWKIWQRNWDVHIRTWKVNFLPPILEPILYLLAFGAGLGALVKQIRFEGKEISYISFIAPSLVAITIMNNAFFENTYASFVRMYFQKTFDALMSTPLVVDEIITGEILWGATKSLMASVLMLAAISPFGIPQYPESFLILPVSIVGGFAFASLGMCFTGIVPRIEVYNFPIFLFITPMFLFSGTFFPLENLPVWAQNLALALPLTHLVSLVRTLTIGTPSAFLLWNLLYLICFGLINYMLALYLMRKRLIK